MTSLPGPKLNGLCKVSRRPEFHVWATLLHECVEHPPDIELLPPELIFNSQNDRQMRIIWLKQHGTAPATLLDAVPPSDKFHSEIQPVPNSYDYRIYVTAGKLESESSQTNTLVLKMLDSANHKKNLAVPILVAAEIDE